MENGNDEKYVYVKVKAHCFISSTVYPRIFCLELFFITIDL
jgi:hypothetical protein